MKVVIFTFLLLCVFKSFSQDASMKNLQAEAAKIIKKDVDTVSHKWRKGGLFSLNLSQGSLSNWTAGGDNFSLSINSYFSLFAFYKSGKCSWDNTLDMNFGYVNTTSLGSRKNDDRIDLLSKAGYAIQKKLSISTLFNFRSQFTKGYNYPNDTTKVLTSDFLSPGYVLISLGLDYKPNNDLSIFASPITSRWLIVSNDSLSAHGAYGVPPGNKSNNEIGAFVTINYIKALNKLINYKGRVDLFSNYQHNPQNIDVYMTNLFSTKLSKILTASWSVDLIYDDDIRLFGKLHQSPGLQLKSLIGVGLTVKI